MTSRHIPSPFQSLIPKTPAHNAVIVGFASLLFVALASHHARAADAMGVWIDHTGRGAVEITSCGPGLCGRIVWLRDDKNVKACGIQILGNVPPKGPETWEGGWIYDPEDDAKYDVEISLMGEDKLRVYGYAGIKLFGETMVWTRAPADLPRCKPDGT